MATSDLLLVLSTCPTGQADALAHALVDTGCAACVNVIDSARSVYRWQGQTEHAEESLLIIKTSATAYPQLELALRNRHPYEVPEILALPVVGGLSEYLTWVRDNTCDASLP
jgi:periplasmic divalent cation tolerance protein